VKSSTVTVGYDVGVTNIVKVHAVMTKSLRISKVRMRFLDEITLV